MRIFLAGGSGVLGVRLVPELVRRGHTVTAMTRTPEKADRLRALGAEPVVCDAFDRDALVDAVDRAAPDTVIHQLTDLPDRAADLASSRAGNARIREAGTANLVEAARRAEAGRFVAQSIAWLVDGARPAAVESLERQTLAVDGIVLRYGAWYGPGTFHPDAAPPEPRVGIDTAAGLTADALDLAPGVYVVTDGGIAPAT